MTFQIDVYRFTGMSGVGLVAYILEQRSLLMNPTL